MMLDLVSIICPAYNEEENVDFIIKKAELIQSEFQEVKWQFIFIDDGSSDQTCDLLSKNSLINSKVIRLNQNYGSHVAINCGLYFADGDYVSMMSADGQEPNDLPIKLYHKIKQDKLDLVFAVRESRATDQVSSMFSKIYNYLVRYLVNPKFPNSGTDIFMMKKDLINQIRKKYASKISIYLSLFQLNANMNFLPYQQNTRVAGKSKWSLFKKVKLLCQTFTFFTSNVYLVTYVFCLIVLIYFSFIVPVPLLFFSLMMLVMINIFFFLNGMYFICLDPKKIANEVKLK
jgi:glycosyltransferase involved in cell wall biosynthesis